MLSRKLVLLTLLALLALHPRPAASDTVFVDDLDGGTSFGFITGTNTVSFSPTTAVLSSPHDGIMYPAALFPAEGVIEVRLRVDAVDPVKPNEPRNFGAIIDTAGADGRIAGDLFLVVLDTGVVRFTMSTGAVPPFNEFQIEGTTSILDGQFHTVGIAYGSAGIELRIDHIVDATSAFTGLRNTSRDVALGDFTDQQFTDANFGSAFIGEVDWIRSGSTFSSPTTIIDDFETGGFVLAGSDPDECQLDLPTDSVLAGQRCVSVVTGVVAFLFETPDPDSFYQIKNAPGNAELTYEFSEAVDLEITPGGMNGIAYAKIAEWDASDDVRFNITMIDAQGAEIRTSILTDGVGTFLSSVGDMSFDGDPTSITEIRAGVVTSLSEVQIAVAEIGLVPEPSSLSMLTAGSFVIGGLRCRARRRSPSRYR